MATSKENGYQAAEYGDQRVGRGDGGETHQAASDGAPRLTTQQGIVVSDDQNTLRSGVRGPAALEDFHFREKIFHFDHERIPERVVHAEGARRGNRPRRLSHRQDQGSSRSRPNPSQRKAAAKAVTGVIRVRNTGTRVTEGQPYTGT